MKRNSKAFVCAAGLSSIFLVAGCGGKAASTDSAQGGSPAPSTPPAQAQAAGERNSAGQAQHYQDMQQKKQSQNGGQ